jgi:hypothetical protein
MLAACQRVLDRLSRRQPVDAPYRCNGSLARTIVSDLQRKKNCRDGQYCDWCYSFQHRHLRAAWIGTILGGLPCPPENWQQFRAGGTKVNATEQPPAGVKMAQATVQVTYSNGRKTSERLEFPGDPRPYVKMYPLFSDRRQLGIVIDSSFTWKLK